MWSKRGFKPECAFCGGPIIFGRIDMNEFLLTRGDVQSMPDEDAYTIYTRQNCVLVHGKCHQWAHTKYGQRQCIRHIIKWEGEQSVIIWLDNLTFQDSTSLVYARRLFQTVKEMFVKEKQLFARLRKELGLEEDTQITLGMLVDKATSLGMIEEFGQPGPSRVRLKLKGRNEFEADRDEATDWLVERLLEKVEKLDLKASSDRQAARDKKEADKPEPEPEPKLEETPQRGAEEPEE